MKRAKFDSADVTIKERTISGDATDVGLFKWSASKLMNIDKVYQLNIISFKK